MNYELNSVDFSNSFNIQLRFQLATYGQRIVAYLLDWLFMAGYAVAMLYLMPYPIIASGIANMPAMASTLLLALAIPVVFYHLLFETVFSGQTLGKMLVGIKVTQEDGSPVTFASCLLRWSFLLIDFWVSLILGIPGVAGIVSMSSSKQKQRLGDRAAGTIVVRTRIRSHIDLYDEFYSFADSYAPQYQQAVALSEAQVAFIINLLIVSTRQDAFNKDILVIAGKVRNLLGLDKDALGNIGARQFLQGVVKDYNYYALNS